MKPRIFETETACSETKKHINGSLSTLHQNVNRIIIVILIQIGHNFITMTYGIQQLMTQVKALTFFQKYQINV